MTVASSSNKRSRSIPSESWARYIANKTDLFGYQPAVVQVAGQWHLVVRGDGSDDAVIERMIERLQDHADDMWDQG